MMNDMMLIIVLYNKAISDLHILNVNNFLKNKNIDILIYDNSKNAQEILNIEGVDLIYIHDSENSGVSKAYNIGIQKAKELQKNLVLILDQDTNFSLEYIEKYMQMYNIYGNNFLYAPIVCNEDMTKVYSPATLKNFVGKAQPFEDFKIIEQYDLTDKSVINSGLMIPLKLFEKIGGYNEKLKLDFSDIYFIEKYKELNSKIILVDIYLKHSISGDEGKDFNREYNRFKYYCNSAKEIGKSLKKRVFWSPFRRLLRLSLKYKSLKFLKIFYHYYLRGQEI
jgi:GT2 family glycosyltransferase